MNDTPNASEMQKALDKLAERTAALSERQAALETFNALIRLAANPSACKARVDQLNRALDKAVAAEAKLAERPSRIRPESRDRKGRFGRAQGRARRESPRAHRPGSPRRANHRAR